MELLGVKLTLKEYDFLMCEQANGKQLEVVNGKVVAVERVLTQSEINKNKIADLISKLEKTDYQVLKWKEGELTDYEFEPMRLQRKAWREEIRELEKLI